MNEFTQTLCPSQKLTLIHSVSCSYKVQNSKFLADSIGKINLSLYGVGYEILDSTPKA